jgi:hypothetical protein
VVETVKCPYCGFDNPDKSMHCGQCGKRFFYILPFRPAKITKGKILATFIVLLLIGIIGAMFLPICSSTLDVTIHSTHITQTVNYQILINGAVVEQGTLTPGNSITWTIHYQYACAFSGQKAISIVGNSYGGGLGDQSDSHSLTVINGYEYSVTLNV